VNGEAVSAARSGIEFKSQTEHYHRFPEWVSSRAFGSLWGLRGGEADTTFGRGPPARDPPIRQTHGWYEQKVLRDYPAFNAFQTGCEEHGISVEIQSITQGPSTPEDSVPYGLTERQYEALSLALSRGYYEQPRQTTAQELADELGISQPSVLDLLNRAESRLISATLGPSPRLEPLAQ